MDFKAEDIFRLKTLFALHDKKGNGCVNKQDFKVLIQSLGATIEEIKYIFNLDQDYFDFPQFLEISSLIMRDYQEDDLLACFRVFDPENTGEMDRNQLQTILETNSTMDPKDIMEILKQLPDRPLNYHEFIKNSLKL